MNPKLVIRCAPQFLAITCFYSYKGLTFSCLSHSCLGKFLAIPYIYILIYEFLYGKISLVGENHCFRSYAQIGTLDGSQIFLITLFIAWILEKHVRSSGLHLTAKN